MNTSENKPNYSPAIILCLVAIIVVFGWLLVIEKSKPLLSKNSSPQQQQGPENVIEWKMVTSWPKNFPGLGRAPELFAQAVEKASNGRLIIKVYGGGELVPALGVFDAVSLGSVEMGHSGAYYWKGKTLSAVFFASLPFGMNAQEMNAWLHYGGGLELWREVYAPFNLIPFAGGNTGVQMAGWFNKEINSVEDIQGLKMRIPGVGGEVFSRVGGTVVNLPGSELYTALQTGVIDATEWVGPYNDRAFGLHEVAKYYYYPGWHEPGSSLEFIINKDAYASLPKDLQHIVELAARYANQSMLDEYTARNNAALVAIQNDPTIQIKRLPDDVLKAFKQASEAYTQEVIAKDEMAKKVYDSWKAFFDGVKNYHHISEQAYINARDL
jgi:TRAP-type mannitol/chloroaromatic compound transport system substrate-binding protein